PAAAGQAAQRRTARVDGPAGCHPGAVGGGGRWPLPQPADRGGEVIDHLVRFSLRQPLFVWLLLALFIGASVIAFTNLPVEAFPDVTDTQVNVIALYPGRAAEEVEKQVTIPIEIALTGIPNTVRLFSHTQYGLSFTMVTFDDRATDQQARLMVLERLR